MSSLGGINVNEDDNKIVAEGISKKFDKLVGEKEEQSREIEQEQKNVETALEGNYVFQDIHTNSVESNDNITSNEQQNEESELVNDESDDNISSDTIQNEEYKVVQDELDSNMSSNEQQKLEQELVKEEKKAQENRPQVDQHKLDTLEYKQVEIDNNTTNIDELKKKAQKIYISWGNSAKKAKQYPKLRKNTRYTCYAYFNEENMNNKNYNYQKYAPYNDIIDKINSLMKQNNEVTKEVQKERKEVIQAVEENFDKGNIDITPNEAKVIAQSKIINTNSEPLTNETARDLIYNYGSNDSLQESKKEFKENKGIGTLPTDLEKSKSELLELKKKYEYVLTQSICKQSKKAYDSVYSSLENVNKKLENLGLDIERENKENARIAQINELDKAQEEQEGKGVDHIILNGKELKCKTAIIRENDWKDLTKSLDETLLDEKSGRDKGYCNMYNSIMIRRLVTHYAIKQFGGTKRITSIYVKDLNLYINDTLLMYKGELFSESSKKKVPRDIEPYLRNGMLAPFFDWGIFYNGINCGGRPTSLRYLSFDSTKYLADYLAPDLASLNTCKRQDIVQSPYGFMNPTLYFGLFKNLLSVTIEGTDFTRQEWEEHKYDDKYSKTKKLKYGMKREKRRLNLLDGYKLDIYAGTNGFQKFGISSFTNYIHNRGNKGFVRFALGSASRFVLAGAGILTNFTSHLIGGIYHTLKSDNEYEWNESIKDKMDDTDSLVTANDTENAIRDAKKRATKEASLAQ